jgi:hypothetical protein
MNSVIITAASEKYANSLFSLLGSLSCNWPNHPPVKVYDLGLEDKTLLFLKEANIEVKQIDKFCNHWREHYSWKIWCINNEQADIVIWMDAGVCILSPLDEIIDIAKVRNYFIVPNYQFLDYEASKNACKGCGVDYSFRIGKASIAATFMVFKKSGQVNDLLKEAMKIAMTEEYIKAENNRNKHDQAILSLLFYKYFSIPEFEDGYVYLGWKSPRQVSEQKVWLQRRKILREDIAVYKKKILVPGQPYQPKDPEVDIAVIRRSYNKSLIKVKGIVKRVIKKKELVNNGLR